AGLNRLFNIYGLVPAHLNWTNPFTLYPLFTHMFLHAGWLHILSNMWVLIIFGDNVEDRMGSFRYLIFYVLGGLAAALLEIFFSTDPYVPSIGASGAIAAVMGAYLVFYPRARVLTLVLLIIIPWFIELPAIIFIGGWFLIQLFSGILSLSTSGGAAAAGGIAWWAHVGGFLFGVLMGPLFTIGLGRSNLRQDQSYP
ncbi:MAG TPA: rhomboid family intramembrane serine protease, partial [Anaerolineaceae bacterium]|nr:rhomboid family intramembrane serine protease [Anaerolineaceae bacterium]